MELQKLIGLKVVAIKHFRFDRRKQKGFSPDYILFDDAKTYIELSDQDCYTYHDFDYGAKRISIMQDADHWKRMMDNEDDHYPDADKDIDLW